MNKHTFSHSFFWLGLTFLGIVHAANIEPTLKDEQRSPLGCRDMGFDFDLDTVSLKPDTMERPQSMYFFYNKRNTALNLFQIRDKTSNRSVQLNHTISSHQWAVLALTEPNAQFICAVDNPKFPQGEVVDCEQSIKVCQYNHVVYGVNNQGNYWMVKSNTRGGAVNDVIRYGVIPGY